MIEGLEDISILCLCWDLVNVILMFSRMYICLFFINFLLNYIF